MPKRRNRTKARRQRQSQSLKAQVRALQPAIAPTPAIGSGPVHISGQYTNINPANPNNLSRFARECIAAARATQHCAAQPEVMHSHMIIQTARGWTVRAAHPNEPEPETHVLSPSRIHDAETTIVDNHYIRNMAQARAHTQAQADAHRIALRDRRAYIIANLERNQNV